eukprot:2121438-Prymnesium_polylepis.1
MYDERPDGARWVVIQSGSGSTMSASYHGPRGQREGNFASFSQTPACLGARWPLAESSIMSVLTVLPVLTAFVGTAPTRVEQMRATSAPVMAASDRRAVLGTGLLLASGLLPGAAFARPEGVNKPELLPSYQTNVIDLQRFLTSGQVKAMDKQLADLEKATGIKLRVLCQSYPNTPGLAIKDYWGLDDRSIVLVVDKGQSKGGGVANILNFNVAVRDCCAYTAAMAGADVRGVSAAHATQDGIKLSLPNQFWTRLQSTFGNNFFVRDNGEDIAITRAVDTIDYCLRDELAYCVDVPMQFKNPSKAMCARDSHARTPTFERHVWRPGPGCKGLRQHAGQGCLLWLLVGCGEVLRPVSLCKGAPAGSARCAGSAIRATDVSLCVWAGARMAIFSLTRCQWQSAMPAIYGQLADAFPSTVSTRER